MRPPANGREVHAGWLRRNAPVSEVKIADPRASGVRVPVGRRQPCRQPPSLFTEDSRWPAAPCNLGNRNARRSNPRRPHAHTHAPCRAQDQNVGRSGFDERARTEAGLLTREDCAANTGCPRRLPLALVSALGLPTIVALPCQCSRASAPSPVDHPLQCGIMQEQAPQQARARNHNEDLLR